MNLEDLCNKYDVKVLISSSIGDGWVPILEIAFQKLIEKGWNREVAQIKEKFGALRFYIHCPDYISDEEWEEWCDITDEAENKSYSTCEDCGADGKRCSPNGSWVKTLCLHCFDTQKAYFKEKYPDLKEYSWYGSKSKPEQSKTYNESLGIK